MQLSTLAKMMVGRLSGLQIGFVDCCMRMTRLWLEAVNAVVHSCCAWSSGKQAPLLAAAGRLCLSTRLPPVTIQRPSSRSSHACSDLVRVCLVGIVVKARQRSLPGWRHRSYLSVCVCVSMRCDACVFDKNFCLTLTNMTTTDLKIKTGNQNSSILKARILGSRESDPPTPGEGRRSGVGGEGGARVAVPHRR